MTSGVGPINEGYILDTDDELSPLATRIFVVFMSVGAVVVLLISLQLIDKFEIEVIQSHRLVFTYFRLWCNRDESMIPEHGHDNHLIGSVSPFPDTNHHTSRTTLVAEPSLSVVMGSIRSQKVARPNTLVAPVADVA